MAGLQQSDLVSETVFLFCDCMLWAGVPLLSKQSTALASWFACRDNYYSDRILYTFDINCDLRLSKI